MIHHLSNMYLYIAVVFVVLPLSCNIVTKIMYNNNENQKKENNLIRTTKKYNN